MLAKRIWVAVILLGFSGQLAWAVENQFFNTFMYDRITPDPRPISWMVAASAITATVASILMGALSDRTRSRWGVRRPYILLGYIAWGVFTALYPTAAFVRPMGLAVTMAILFDSLMTFCGSTANDAAFNAYMADITTVHNRGRVVGVVQLLTWVALLVVYGGAGPFIQSFGYDLFFYILGGVVILFGLIGGALMREAPPPARPERSFAGQLADTFRWKSLRENRDLLLVLLAMGLWGVAQQIFFPYLIIYLNHFLKLPTAQASLLIFVAILVGGILASYPVGLLVDRWGRRQLAIVTVVAEVVGLSLFSLARSLPALAVTAILWLTPITAWMISVGAWSKDLFPEDKRGQFAGYVILFSVAFTMVPGPLLGGWLATRFGIPTVIDGRAGFIPTPIIFQAAAAATILAIVPLLATGRRPSVSPPPS
jgi:MFS family permease